MHSCKFYKSNVFKKIVSITTSILIVCFAGLETIKAQESEALRQFQYANQLMEDGLYDLAASQFEEFIRLYPDSPKAPEAHFQLAAMWGKMGKWDESTIWFRKLLVKFPEFPRSDQALYAIAENYVNQNKTEEAIRVLERFSLFYPESKLAAKALLRAGELCFEREDLIQAEQHWLRVLQEHPKSKWVTEVRLRLARLYYRKGDLTAAQAQIDHLLDSAPENILFAKISLLKANILANQYKIDQVEKLYQQLMNGNFPQRWQKLITWSYAAFLNKIGNYSKALSLLDPLIRTEETSTFQDSVVCLWMECQFNSGDDQAVLGALQQHQSNFQDSLLWQSALDWGIRSAERQNDHQKTVELIEKRLSFEKLENRVENDIKDLHLKLLREYRTTGRLADALGLGKKILNLELDDWKFTDQVRFELAKIYQQDRQEYRQALFYYEQILAPSHKSELADEAAFKMARCYEGLQDEQHALRIYKNFANTFPGSPLIDQVSDRINWHNLYKPEQGHKELGQMSLLLSNLLLKGDRDEAIFSLIRQLYGELKDYDRTIKLIRLVQEKGLLEDKKDSLDRLLGESLYRQAILHENAPNYMTLLDSARTPLLQYMAATSNHSEQLRIALLIHDIDRRSNRLATMDFLKEYDFLRKMLIRYSEEYNEKHLRFRLARLLHDYGLRATKDSIQSAVSLYDEILNDSTQIGREVKPKYVSLMNTRSFVVPVEEQALFYRGKAYFALGDTTQGEKDLNEYRHLYPRGRFVVEVLETLGQLAVQDQDWRSAEDIYSELSQTFYYAPASDEAKMRLAQIKINMQKYGEAVKLLDQFSGSENGLYFLGVAYQKMGKTLKAREVYNQYLNRYSDGRHVASVYLHLGEMAQKNNQKQEAGFYWERFLNRFPDNRHNTKVRLSLADQEFESRNYQSAFEQYNQLVSGPDGEYGKEIHKKRILCLVRMGKISAAEQALETFKKSFDDPKEEMAEITYEIGNYYLKQKSFESAEEQFKRVRSRYEDTRYGPYGDYGLGKLKLISDHTEDGLKILIKITSRYSDHPVLPQVYLTLGDFYYKTKQFESGMAAFKRVLEFNPPVSVDLTARRYLIKLYSDLGLYDSALIAIKKYLKKYPDQADRFDYQIKIGTTLIKLNEYSRAIDHLRSLLPKANNEQEAEIRYWIGKAYYSMGQFRTAISEYLKVSYLTKPTKLPWRVTAEYESGLAYMKLEEWERASQLFQKIVNKEGRASDFGRVALRKLSEIKQLQKN